MNYAAAAADGKGQNTALDAPATQKEVRGNVDSYLDNPQDAVSLDVGFQTYRMERTMQRVLF